MSKKTESKKPVELSEQDLEKTQGGSNSSKASGSEGETRQTTSTFSIVLEDFGPR